MTDPIIFENATPRFSLPLLYVAQARKEHFVNEAMTRIDALLHCTVEGEATLPPTEVDDGQCWIVGADAAEDWAGHGGALACRQGGGWSFISPRQGQRVYDRSLGQERHFNNFWQIAALQVEPVGGSTVDAEARTAINELVSSLQALGLLPSA